MQHADTRQTDAAQIDTNATHFFRNSLGIPLAIETIIAQMVGFMAADTKRRYKVTIGSDSELTHGHTADFVTAIVIHRVGNGGKYFWRRAVTDKRFYNLHDRILEEVLISLSVAKDFLAACERCGAPPFDFEIHVDVGENGASRSMIQELVGMIRANNFEAKTKPESYAASNVADRYV